MKAEIVRNTKGDPRLLLRFETEAERELFAKAESLDLLRTAWEDEKLVDMSFVLREHPHPEYGPCDEYGPDRPTCSECAGEVA